MNNMIYEIFYAVLIVVIPILAKYLIAYLESIKTDNERVELNSTIYEAISIVQKSVDYVSQTFVDSLKKSNSFDKESQLKAFRMAYETSYNLMSQELKQLIKSMYGDFDNWLTVEIESYIKQTKIGIVNEIE